MKKMILGLVAAIMTICLAGCGKDAAAESTPEVKTQEESVAETSVDTTEPAKVGQIKTEVSTPVEEPDEAEESEPELIDEADNLDDFSDFDYDDPSSIDYRAFLNGDIFELDDYCVALGYSVTLPDPEVDGVSYYTISSCGRDYSIMNYGFTLQISYVDFEADQIHTAGISKFGYHDPKNMVVRGISQDSDDVSEKWIQEISEVLRLIATEEVDFSNLPITAEYYHVVDEGRWQYQPNKILLWEVENMVSNQSYNT